MENGSKIFLFVDNEPAPVASFDTPVNFELDTHKLTDGEHELTIISRSPTGREGIRKIPFTVKNGPDISVEGIKEHAVVDGIIPLMVNAYSKGDQTRFLIRGSETPQSIPSWLWVLVLGVGVWVLFYFIAYITG